ncbi:shikimate kinase [Engelhardtia mirabilis]|uniref:Topology modulation protein n=1 Tax=Engelhardtia mirabilis TaxID=2528011 RepID=A0A518BS95_9BACT|nr:topology modulation protein [Planctomycetes bacterium Pla133]QDV04179.1 topology modulation protein [Planctomycetes bacterium Pla86]
MGAPERLWILGQPGSGKSTLGARLAPQLGARWIDLDELHWLPGWRERPQAQTAQLLAQQLEVPRWVVTGNYASLSAPHLHRADVVVWLDLDLGVLTRRLLARSIRRAWTGEQVCGGNRERWWRLLHPTDSILFFMWRVHLGRRRRYEARLAGLKHVRLRSPGAVEAWIEGLLG